MSIKDFYASYSDEQIDELKNHLRRRFEFRKNKRQFGVVYDILSKCDLNCRGCGTNAVFTLESSVDISMPSMNEIRLVYEKIKEYADSQMVPVFINIGGGEPFLRKDILEVLKTAAEYFGVNGVGVDTNGTLDNSFDLISEALDYVSYVGISVNGLEAYNNWWAGNPRINAFDRAVNLVKRLCGDSKAVSKIEVTSVATKNNITELPVLIEILSDFGVKNYSIHRAMPIGRLARYPELIPNADDYLRLLVDIIERSKKCGINVHLHHSIESIHATLLLGLKTYVPDKVGDPDAGSSLGIEPEGNLVFDPWCTTGFWKKLSGGNIYDDKISIADILDGEGSGTIFDLSKIYTAPHLRCKGCDFDCSGGSRIAAAANILNSISREEVTESHIFDAMTAIDPACPLFKD